MVRGGLGVAKMMPGKDIWQVSELSQSAFSSAYQVGQQRSCLSSTTTTAAWGVEGGGASLTAAHPTYKDHLPSHACLCHFRGKLIYSHHLEICPLKSDLLGIYVDSSKQGSIFLFHGLFFIIVILFLCDRGASTMLPHVLVYTLS